MPITRKPCQPEDLEPGDIVVCIDDYDAPNLRLGHEYRVTAVGRSHIYLAWIVGSYLPRRFAFVRKASPDTAKEV